MTARVEKLIRPAQKLSEWEKEKYVHDFICENIRYDKLKNHIPMKLSDRWGKELVFVRELQKQ